MNRFAATAAAYSTVIAREELRAAQSSAAVQQARAHRAQTIGHIQNYLQLIQLQHSAFARLG